MNGDPPAQVASDAAPATKNASGRELRLVREADGQQGRVRLVREEHAALVRDAKVVEGVAVLACGRELHLCQGSF